MNHDINLIHFVVSAVLNTYSPYAPALSWLVMQSKRSLLNESAGLLYSAIVPGFDTKAPLARDAINEDKTILICCCKFCVSTICADSEPSSEIIDFRGRSQWAQLEREASTSQTVELNFF